MHAKECVERHSMERVWKRAAQVWWRAAVDTGADADKKVW